MGRCPECGAYFDRVTGEGVIKPLTPRQRGDQFLRRLRTWSLLAGAGFILAGSGLASWIAGHFRPLVVGGFLAGVVLLAAATSYVYENED